MEQKEPKYESIKAKLLKLQALVEGGSYGESQVAKLMLDRLCEKYGISVDKILNDDETKTYCFDRGRTKILKDLFMQCYAKVTGNRVMSYRIISQSAIKLELTPYQYAELSSFYDWHRKNFKKEMEEKLGILLSAYIHKHDLFSGQTSENEKKEIDKRRLWKMICMMESLNNNTYHKLLER